MFRIDRTLVNMESIEANIETVLQDRFPGDKYPGDKNPANKYPAEAVDEDAQTQARDNIKEPPESVAEEIIRLATIKADDIIRAAEDEALEIKKAARQKGYEDGVLKANSELKKALEDDSILVKNTLKALEQTKQDMLDSIEEDVLKLTFAIVKKVFNQVNKSDSSMFESMIVNALKQMKKEGKVTIRVSKEEYDRFFSSGDASFVLGDKYVVANILPDAHMNSGDLLIESDGETVNAGLDCQIRNIETAFKQTGGVSI